MIKVINIEAEEGRIYGEAFPKIFVEVIEDVDGFDLKVSFTQFGREFTRTKRYNYAEYKGKAIQINIQNTEFVMEMTDYEIFSYVDKYANVKNSQSRRSVFDIARVVFDEECKNVIILFKYHTNKIGNVERIPFDYINYTGVGILKKHSEFFKKLHDKYTTKSKMINQIDQYNSIAYLESQVDILTRLVLKLLSANNIIDEEKEILAGILSKVEENSVLDIKDIESVMKEFENKKHVRELQRKYYEDKQKNLN